MILPETKSHIVRAAVQLIYKGSATLKKLDDGKEVEWLVEQLMGSSVKLNNEEEEHFCDDTIETDDFCKNDDIGHSIEDDSEASNNVAEKWNVQNEDIQKIEKIRFPKNTLSFYVTALALRMKT